MVIFAKSTIIYKTGNISKVIFRPILLSLLILFSSCTTRNLVQHHFDVPLTKTLNVAKSAHALQNCAELQIENKASELQSPGAILLFSSVTGSRFSSNLISFDRDSAHQITVNSSSSVPLYILLSRLKIFS